MILPFITYLTTENLFQISTASLALVAGHLFLESPDISAISYCFRLLIFAPFLNQSVQNASAIENGA